MTESDKSIYSSCREIAVLDPDRGISLVQHEPTRRIYVKKVLPAQSADVYRWLHDHYIEGIPAVVDVVRVPACAVPGESVKTGDSVQTVTRTNMSRLAESSFSSAVYALEEYVTGQTLLEILDNGNLFPVEEAVDIMEQLCRILQALRSARPPITGCDLDPANIILTSDGLVRIRDLRSAGQTGDDTLQSDLRAVGSLFCRLLIGCPPDHCNSGEKSSGASGKNPAGNAGRPPEGRPLPVPGGTPGRIIRRCLAPDPSKQYPDLQILLRDLDACRPHPTVDHSITSDSNTAEAAPRNHPYLLPGFRSGNPLHYMAAIFAYVLLIRLSLTFTLDKFPPGGYQMWVERLVFFLCGSVILLFTGNYMDVWHHLRITKIRTTLLQLLVVLIIDAALFMLSILAIIITGLALGVYHSSLF